MDTPELKAALMSRVFVCVFSREKVSQLINTAFRSTQVMQRGETQNIIFALYAMNKCNEQMLGDSHKHMEKEFIIMVNTALDSVLPGFCHSPTSFSSFFFST